MLFSQEPRTTGKYTPRTLPSKNGASFQQLEVKLYVSLILCDLAPLVEEDPRLWFENSTLAILNPVLEILPAFE
jgi:hypothetical protein